MYEHTRSHALDKDQLISPYLLLANALLLHPYNYYNSHLVNRSVTGAPAGVRGLQIWEWEVKRGLRNRTLLSKLANGSDLDIELGTSVKSVLYKRAIWEKHVEWQMDGDSNESVYARCARGAYVNWVKGVAEWVKKNPLRWFGYNERMQTRVCEKKKCIGAKPKVQTGGVSHLEDKKIR